MDEESSYGAGDSTTCEPTSAGCAKCDTREDQDQTYCSTNGFKQEVECSIGRLSNGSAASSYFTFQTCQQLPGDFTHFVLFELVMILVFTISYSWLVRRKRQALAHQQYRINEVMGN